MSSPVELSDLPVANLALSNDPSAIMLMRVGLTDYQVSVAIIRNINLQVLSTLPNGTPLVTDKMLVNRIVGGVASNFQVTFGQVGFAVGTRLWFYNKLPPAPNWSIVANTGGNLLAAQDASKTYAGNVTAGNPAGTWQQLDAFLTIAQMPAHTHTIPVYKSDQKGNLSTRVGSTNQSSNNRATTDSTGGGAGHNHGNSWRPLANVGVIGNKDF
jgi:hypothetical protein